MGKALNDLVNEIVFNNLVDKNFSSNEEDSLYLIKIMKDRGFSVNSVLQDSYFYCEIENDKISVCADSRANLKPRHLKEAICVAAIKVYINNKDNKKWNELFEALNE